MSLEYAKEVLLAEARAINNLTNLLDNGFVKAVGKFKRRKNATTLLIPSTTIISIEESEDAGEEEAPVEEKV